MSIIELNGKQFAKGKSGLVDTLFNPKGSADGFYTVKLDGIALHKPLAAETLAAKFKRI